MFKIPVARPIISPKAKKLLTQCLDSGWVSSSGPMIEMFEKKFAHFIGTKYAVATNSGTSAIHLSLVALNIKPGDEIIVPALTMVATVLPIIYLGATPILVDSEKNTGNIDVNLIEKKITKKTTVIIAVDLHGHPTDMENLLKIAKKHHLFLVNDAAEAHGALYKFNNSWIKTGSLGDIACFSFYGNKIITTGEGGMAVTNNKKLAMEMKSLRNLSRSPNQHFLHQKVAFAYRMSSLQAALGVAQLDDANIFINRKREIAKIYNHLLLASTNPPAGGGVGSPIPYLELPIEKPYAKSVFWQYGIIVKNNSPISRNQLEKILTDHSIETRRFFVPMHQQPAFINLGLFKNEKYPIAEDLSKKGLCLPSGLAIKDSEIKYVCKIINQAFQRARP